MAKKSDGVIKHRIVLEGEKEYKKALTDINRSLRVTSSELKANKAAFADAEKSEEALRSRLELLEREHEQASEKVRLLTEHLEKVKKAYGESSSEADGMRISLNNAKAALSAIGNEAQDTRRQLARLTDGAEDAGDALGDMAERAGDGALGSMDEMADALAGKLGDAAKNALSLGSVLGVAKKSMELAWNASVDAMEAQQTLAISTGLTGEALDAMEKSANAVMRTGLFSNRREAANVMAGVYRNTHLTGEALEQATRDAQLLDTSFGVDISESSRTANSLMQAFGISAQDAYDLMAHGIQNGADVNGDLMDTLREYSPMFSQMGFSAEEFTGVLERGAQNGVFSVDKIGDAMKEFYLRMTDGDEKTREALASLGLESADVMQKLAAGGETGRAAFDLVIEALEGIADPVLRNQIAVAMFGTQAEDMGYNVEGLFRDVDGAAADAEGTMQAINDVKMGDLDTEFNKLKANLTENLIPAAQTAAGILKDINEGFAIWDQMEASDTGYTYVAPKDANLVETAMESYSKSIEAKENNPLTKWLDSLFGFDEKEKNKTKAAESGAAVGEGFVGGIDGGLESVGLAGRRLGGAALGGLNEIMMIHSPSRATQESGGYFDDGLVLGIDAGVPDAEHSAQELARATIDALRQALEPSTGREIGLDWGEGLAQGLSASQGRVSAAAQRLAARIEEATRGALDIHSPSRVGMEIGLDWGEGIALGEEASMDGVREAALGIAEVMERSSVPGAGRMSGPEIDYAALGEAVADACVRRGLGTGDMAVWISAEDAADALTPGISRRIARGAAMTVTGRAKRL